MEIISMRFSKLQIEMKKLIIFVEKFQFDELKQKKCIISKKNVFHNINGEMNNNIDVFEKIKLFNENSQIFVNLEEFKEINIIYKRKKIKFERVE